ncbi:glycerophosphodiester phosphodiesterase family protein [Actinotalea sp. Marseille-Q4924]|uniref:glycerophosphodiester phosphodiesterase family protein n=1 Tax=Actinotalea sp. Marseille-Q4924 TaxID=2866571 RepID=UPI001CE45B82|nr:glycerophosphodiester phosphodiesterase family protein [Actinotalea sp. Marseille-Q4924]
MRTHRIHNWAKFVTSVAGVGVLTATGATTAMAAVDTQVQVAVPADPQCTKGDPPHIVGHRGSAGLSPENTIASFEQAADAEADYIEVDVNLSADGELVLFHDTTGARTTNVAEVFPDRADDPLVTFTFEELRQLDAGSYFSDEFDGELVPTLVEAAQATDPQTGISIELKSPQNSPGVEQALATALEDNRYWQRLIARDQILVSSFDEQSLRMFHELAPHIPVLYIGDVPESDAELADLATWADGIVTNYRNLDPADVQRVQATGLTIDVYTVNSVDHMLAVTELGVDSVITDFPDVLARVQCGLDPIPGANGIEVLDVVEDVPGSDLQPETGEHVVLTNTGDTTVDVSGYVLQDAVINRLVVGEGYTLAPGATLNVYTGTGTNTADKYYVGGTSNVLNNSGDSIAVFTPDLELVDLYAYY